MLAAIGLPIVAGTQETTPTAPSRIALLEAFAAEVSNLTADFTQETWTQEQELVERLSGRFALSRPHRFLWHYETPFEQLVVADGESLWIYDVELEQVTRSPLDDASASNPALLLSGDAAISDGFDLDQSFTLDGKEWLRLIPKEPGGDFSSVLIGFESGSPRVLELVDGLNQTTRVEFADVEINLTLDPEQFEFQPPRGTSVIGPDL